MKIGIGINSYSRWGEERYKKLKEHGYSCVDFDMVQTEAFPYTETLKETEALLLKEKALALEADVDIYQVHGPWRWPPVDFTAEDRNERMEKMKTSLWATSVLGCKNWVIHPIMPYGVQDKNTDDQKKTWELNLIFMTKLLKTAKEHGITICLENMPMLNFSIATPSDILKFVKTINDDNFKICLDTGHIAAFSELSAGAAVRELGNEIRAFHIHDSRPKMDLHLPPHFGTTDWDDFSRALKEIGFSGSLCLETAPPSSLPTDIYEEMCISLAKITDRIANRNI